MLLTAAGTEHGVWHNTASLKGPTPATFTAYTTASQDMNGQSNIHIWPQGGVQM